MASSFSTYWKSYGGMQALVKSKYLWASLAFSFLVAPLWWTKEVNGASVSFSWVDVAFGVAPSMLGLSLGAMAIMLAIGPGTFLKLAQIGGNDSYFMKAVAAFFHFMVIQTLAILFALVVIAWPIVPLSFVGFLLFVYSIFSGLAAAATLVGLAEVKTEADQHDL